jgi:sporulation protein YlmC with PRC-barrel domain
VSTRTIARCDLLGRTVRDTNGTSIGRIEELNAEIDLHGDGNDYVVTSVSVGRFGVLDVIATGRFVQHLGRRLARLTGYARSEIPWDWLDFGDPARPRLLRAAHELSRDG